MPNTNQSKADQYNIPAGIDVAELLTPFSTDLDNEERIYYAKLMRNLADSAQKTAEALETGNDDEAVNNFIRFSIMLVSTKQLNDIVLKAVLKTRQTKINELSGIN